MKLPTIDFDVKSISLETIFENEKQLKLINANSLIKQTPEKIKQAYGEFYFPAALPERPYTFASFVFSIDGKIGFEDNPIGPLISQKNKLDPQGGLIDFWFLNLLRTYSDVIILGAKTLQVEPEASGHIFDLELERARVKDLHKTNRVPINLVVSLDATDIPFDHDIFKHPERKVWINTSPEGVNYLQENCPHAMLTITPKPNENYAEYKEKILTHDGIVVICTGKGNLTNAEILLSSLRKLGMQHVLIESPSYSWHLMQKGLLDEAFINYSGLFAGGPITFGLNQPFTAEDHPHTEFLKIAIHQSNFIYTRQKLIYNSSI